jgi:hypothetical protein
MERLGQNDFKFAAILSYIRRPCFKKTKKFPTGDEIRY